MDKRLLTDLTATPKGKERSIFADNSKHCKNLYVGGVGVSLQRVACSLPILLCWFEILAELPRAPKAPAGGASIAIRIGNPSRRENLVVVYVRTYARIRPGDKFVFVFDLESFLRKK